MPGEASRGLRHESATNVATATVRTLQPRWPMLRSHALSKRQSPTRAPVRAAHFAAAALVLSTLHCGHEAAPRDLGRSDTGGTSPAGGVSGGTGGTPAAGSSATAAGNGGTPAGNGGTPAGAGSGSGGSFRNPCDPWPMTQACLTPEEVAARGGSHSTMGSGGEQSGAGGEDSASEGGARNGLPTTTECPELPPNSIVSPCVDGIGGPPTHVSVGRCCWTCRMVCG